MEQKDSDLKRGGYHDSNPNSYKYDSDTYRKLQFDY